MDQPPAPHDHLQNPFFLNPILLFSYHFTRNHFTFSLLFLFSSSALAIINPRFTPKHLVEQSELVLAGPVEPTANALEWKLTATPIKGKAATEHVVSLAACNKDHVADIQQALKANAKDPAILFSGTLNEEKRAYLHVAGLWLDLKAAGEARWSVLGYAPQMAGTYAGGTDMLIRMSKHLADDPDADVPVTAGVRWMAHAKAGNVPGDIAGLAAIEFPALNKPCLFVGSAAGDKLFRAKGDEAMEDITAAAKLDTRSRRFAWLDLDGDGLADLVSWDGSAAAVRLASADGTFKPAAAAPKLGPDCLALTPCSTDGRPALVVSGSAPFLLVADAKGGWSKAELPAGTQEGLGQPSPCIAADLDNDGFVDIVQPGESAGTLWRGKPGGFSPPAKSPLATGGGVAVAAAGDYNQDGYLDIFLAGPERNTLWENDGKGGFHDVFRYSGSMSYKCPPHATAAATMDINHDGRQDLCLVYAEGDLLYHWNRGFRAFGEEGEVRLPGIQGDAGQARLGQRALLAADLNADGSSDLAVVLTNGDLIVCFNDQASVPGVCLRLPKGVTGPVTASVWIGEKHPVCLAALPVVGHSPATFLCTRYPGKATVRFHLPAKPDQTATLAIEDAPKEFVLPAR
ncbi:MAG: VCBS repeat-containing protein [Planctomycetes bacterium]|nr:VCBS repeat-containing protein [Planctomycetota bacterium]